MNVYSGDTTWFESPGSNYVNSLEWPMQLSAGNKPVQFVTKRVEIGKNLKHARVKRFGESRKKTVKWKKNVGSWSVTGN